MSLAQTARRGMPDSPAAADTLGWVYYQKGVYRPAIDMLREALKLGEKNKAPDNPNIHYHLGMAYAEDRSTRARAPAIGTRAEDQSELQRGRRDQEAARQLEIIKVAGDAVARHSFEVVSEICVDHSLAFF